MRNRPPRVCIITTSHRARDDRIFHKQARSLAAHGYHVTLVAQDDRKERLEDVQLVPLPEARGRFQRYFRQPWRALRQALRERADVYHIHDPELVWVGLLLKCAGRRVIYDVHEDYGRKLSALPLPRSVRCILAPLWDAWERLASTFFDHVIAADSYIREKFGSRRSSVVGNMPPKSFGRQSRRKRDDGVLRLVYAGGIDASRGIAKILDALTRLMPAPIEFHVAGPAGDPELERALSRHPGVHFRGFLPWEQVNAYLAEGDVGALLLQPVAGYENCTGEGIVKLFEYMSVGLPVLISDFPKLKRLIHLLDAGIAVDPTDPQAIADGIRYLYDNPSRREAMGENGRRAVLERYNWEHEEKKLLDLYARLLPDKAP